LSGTVKMLEGRDAIQRDLYRLERWAHANLLKLRPVGVSQEEGHKDDQRDGTPLL